MLLKSPVNRMGGKYYLASWLSQYIPEHVTYVEPFCGAGHLLFAKEHSPVEVINDIDSHLIGFFELLKDDTKRSKLIQTLDNMLYSRILWQEIRSRWKAGNIPVDEIERVSQWFYLNRACFSGDQGRGGFAVPSITGRNPCISFRNVIKDFDDIAERLRGVTIECLDYVTCVKRYDSEDTLFYCDPPYLNTEHYYGDPFSHEDHHRLSELLHGIKKVKQWFHTTLMSFTAHCTRAGINTPLRVLKDRIKRNRDRKSLLRWNAFILILNQLKHGGYSMRWNNLNDFILWAVSFELTRAVCWVLWWGCNGN